MSASKVETYRSRIDKAQSFSEVWKIVKDSVKDTLGEHRVGMMLFLDDLPLQLGAYHPLGTNNIVLNRTLVQVAEAATKSKRLVNAFVYSLLVFYVLFYADTVFFNFLYYLCCFLNQLRLRS